jgi:hypothetical protein
MKYDNFHQGYRFVFEANENANPASDSGMMNYHYLIFNPD